MKHIARAIPLIIGVAVLPLTGHAKGRPDPVYSPALNTCINHSGAADSAMAQCNMEEYGRQDGALNAVYQKLVVKLNETPERKEALRAAQRLWVQYRDAECKYESSADAGFTMGPLIESGCLLQMTYDRVQELKGLLEQESF